MIFASFALSLNTEKIITVECNDLNWNVGYFTTSNTTTLLELCEAMISYCAGKHNVPIEIRWWINDHSQIGKDFRDNIYSGFGVLQLSYFTHTIRLEYSNFYNQYCVVRGTYTKVNDINKFAPWEFFTGDKLLSNKYDSSKTYNIGDFCSYKNNIYQCTTKISTPESFTPEKWNQTVIGDYLSMMMPYIYCYKNTSASIDLSKYTMNYEVIIGVPGSASGISSNIGRYWVNILQNNASLSDIFTEQNSPAVSSISLSDNVLNITFTKDEYHTVAIRPIRGYRI